MTCFTFLIKLHIQSILKPPGSDEYQFAYTKNRNAEVHKFDVPHSLDISHCDSSKNQAQTKHQKSAKNNLASDQIMVQEMPYSATIC